MAKISFVSENFVNLLEKSSNWYNVLGLSPEEMAIVIETMETAGFDREDITVKTFADIGFCEEKSLGNTIEVRYVNGVIIQTSTQVDEADTPPPFDAKGKYDPSGREWMRSLLDKFAPVKSSMLGDALLSDEVIQSIQNTITIAKGTIKAPLSKEERRQNLVEQVASEIKRSIPLTPILFKISDYECYLSERWPEVRNSHLVEHSRDNHEIVDPDYVGIHKYCGSGIKRKRSAEKLDTLVCSGCYVKSDFQFPRTLKTYGELRTVFDLNYTKSGF